MMFCRLSVNCDGKKSGKNRCHSARMAPFSGNRAQEWRRASGEHRAYVYVWGYGVRGQHV
eukprot:4181752-Prymnesium_polylepis.1